MKKKNITIEDLAIMINKGFEGVGKKFEKIDKRFDQVDKKINKLENRVGSLEKGQKKIQETLNSIQSEIKVQHIKQEGFERRLSILEEAKIEQIQSQA